MSDIKSLLKIPDFRRLWIAQVVSNFGDSLAIFSLLFLVQRLTGSAASVAGVMIAMALPTLLIGLGAGVWVDRLDRKTTMIWSDVVRALIAPLFLFVRDPGQVWMVYVLAFLLASVGTFFMPAKGAILPRIVGRERLLAANSVGESSRVLFSVLGTAAAGFIVGFFDGFAVAFTVDALTFVVSAVLVSRMIVSGAVEKAESPEAPSVVRELMAGLRVIRRSRLLLGMLVSAGITMLGIGAVNALLVPFVLGDLALRETWFGLLEAAQSTSMVIAGALTASIAARLKPTRLIPISLGAVGLAVMAFAGVTEVWQLAVLLFLVGWFVTPMQASFATIVQTETPPELLGRTGAALNAALTGSSVLSMGIAGGLAAIFGVRSVFFAGGVLVVISALVAVAMFRGATAAPMPEPVPMPEGA